MVGTREHLVCLHQNSPERPDEAFQFERSG